MRHIVTVTFVVDNNHSDVEMKRDFRYSYITTENGDVYAPMAVVVITVDGLESPVSVEACADYEDRHAYT